MNDPVIKLCVYRCSDYVSSCKQLPLIMMKRKVLGHKFSKEKAQKAVYFSPEQIGLWSWLLLLFSWKLTSTKMSRIALLCHSETVWAMLDGKGRCTKTYRQGHGKYERIGVFWQMSWSASTGFIAKCFIKVKGSFIYVV